MFDSTDIIDELAGGSGVDTVRSRGSFNLGSQRVKGDVENLTLTGAANVSAAGDELDNTLIGNSGANVLFGNGGNDRMVGGGGNDSYTVGQVGDVVDESVAGSSGIDTVRSVGVSISLSGPKVLGLVENVTLLGGDRRRDQCRRQRSRQRPAGQQRQATT